MAYSKRNNALEFYRFVFIVFIFFMHFRSYGGFEGDKNYFAAGYLGVEYFFILSGFFMMQKVEKLFASNFVFCRQSQKALSALYFLAFSFYACG
mgnify:CR=1 FL=1